MTREHFRRIDQAKYACYDRLHPKPWIDTSRGARQLYDAVCFLWIWAAGAIDAN